MVGHGSAPMALGIIVNFAFEEILEQALIFQYMAIENMNSIVMLDVVCILIHTQTSETFM